MSATRRTRIAPTPSGFLHEGNVANFVLNATLAGRSGDLLLRIDDLDRARYRTEYLEDIFRILGAFDIQPTLGPETPDALEKEWSQHHRLPLYLEALDNLRGHQYLFACPCSRKELAGGEHQYDCLSGAISLDAPKVAWRVNTRLWGGPILLPDLVAKEAFQINPHAAIPDFVVRTKSGRPSYQLACTVDDRHFGVTHVGRGQDLLGSTAAQVVVSEMLDYPTLLDRIQFLHHPLLLSKSGEKLSKSAGSGGRGLLIDPELRERIRRLVDSWLSQPIA